jgi:hypothetical protein
VRDRRRSLRSRPDAARAAVLGAGAVAVAMGLWAPSAGAWCRGLACDPDGDEGPLEGQACDPPDPERDVLCGGKPVAWRRPCIGFALQKDASSQVPLDVAHEVLGEAFRTWQRAECGDGHPAIRVHDLGDVDCGTVEYNKEGPGNVSLVVFRDDGWPTDPRHASNQYALTTTTHDMDTGDLLDADIEVNTAAPNIFTTDDSVDGIDLLSVLVHEAGHFLGLGHSAVGTATMYESYGDGQRTLEPDDLAGICAMYPPGSQPLDEAACNPIPKHGYSPMCAVDQTIGNCATAAAAPSPARAPADAALAAFAALALGARRRRAASNG